ncbi:MAG: rRNA maturation RNase YbeY [Clostridia bacterium]
MKIFFTNATLCEKLSITRTIKFANSYLKQTNKLEMTVNFVSSIQIAELNQQFRQINSTTDVLSFPTLDAQTKTITFEDYPSDINFKTGNIIIGEIFINRERGKEQAIEYAHSYKRELNFLALHGYLHLLGYDHLEETQRQIMEELQRQILQRLNINR